MVEVKDYRHYLICLKKWDSYKPEEHEYLRNWYRNYYQLHKEKEQARNRDHYKTNNSKRRKLTTQCNDGSIEAFFTKLLKQ